MDETIKELDGRIVELERIIENTHSGLFMLNEQLKTTTARLSEAVALRERLARPLPSPLAPLAPEAQKEQGEGENAGV